MSTTLRIHPAIGIARCGNSTGQYVIAPETSAGMPQTGQAPDPEQVCGGLPIKAGTEDTPVSDQDLRDAGSALKPHAQRFRIYAYASTPDGSYPYRGEVSEVTIGSVVDGQTVSKITWQVHMANKKANSYIIPENPVPRACNDPSLDYGIGGLAHYAAGKSPELRNINFGTDKPVIGGNKAPDSGADKSQTIATQNDPTRLAYLVIDAGPKTISASAAGGAGSPVQFNAGNCTYLSGDGTVSSVDYPTQFPGDKFDNMYIPDHSGALDSLGWMETDAQGRLYVVGSQGFAAGWRQNQNNPSGQSGSDSSDPFPLTDDVDNDGWFDDTADGPVYACLEFENGSKRMINVPAWCVTTDPSYAPQVRNVVSIWDEVYNSWVRAPELNLQPDLYDVSAASQNDQSLGYNADFNPDFYEDVWSIFRAAHLQMFSTDLNTKGKVAHRRVNDLTPDANPADYLNIKSFIRDPNTASENSVNLQTGVPLMPLALGDTGAAFLTVTHTQYFFLNQWFDGKSSNDPTPLSAGENLDKVTLSNLLGGRFSPGIDLTFVVRDPYLYNTGWQNADVGPFRIAAKPIDYSSVTPDRTPLSAGYIPNSQARDTVEPGDLCKFMALPWHTDYNSCATHRPSPNPSLNTTLFWSWPAQRPVSVYTYSDYKANGNTMDITHQQQHFSVRGEGTQWHEGENNDPEYANGPSSVGRYQERVRMIENWFNIGTVVQGHSKTIDGFKTDPTNPELFLEVESLLTGASDYSQPWPIYTTDDVITEAEYEDAQSQGKSQAND